MTKPSRILFTLFVMSSLPFIDCTRKLKHTWANLGQRFGTSKMHLNHIVALVAVPSKVVVLLLLIRCWLLLPLQDSVIVLCFVVCYFMSILVCQSSWWGGESWLLCFVCLPGVSWLLCDSSSWCHGFVCSLWLWYFLIILTSYFCSSLKIDKYTLL